MLRNFPRAVKSENDTFGDRINIVELVFSAVDAELPRSSSPYHVVADGDFAACAILARAARRNHWEMGEEVVNFGEALNTCVTAAIGAAKE